MIRGLWAFLRGLFRRPTPTARVVAPPDPPQAPSAAEATPEPEPEPLDVQPVEVPAPEASPALQASDDDADADEGEDEDWWGDEEDDLADDEPDPFITGTTATEMVAPGEIELQRQRSRIQALAGEHRVYLSNPAGPGSLAEALNQLLAEGLVEARFVDESDEGPHILYCPVS